MKNSLAVMAIVASFVIGTIVTGSTVYAADKPNGQPFDAIWEAIGLLQTQIDSSTLQFESDMSELDSKVVQNESEITSLDSRVNVLETTPPNSLKIIPYQIKIDVPYTGGYTEYSQEIHCPSGSVIWPNILNGKVIPAGVIASANVDKSGSPYTSEIDPTTSFLMKFSHNKQSTNDGWIKVNYKCLEIIP